MSPSCESEFVTVQLQNRTPDLDCKTSTMAEKLTRKEKIALQKSAPVTSVKQIQKQEKNKRSFVRLLGLIVAAVGFILYANTLNHDYVLDDFGLIRDNTQTKKGISAIPEIFKSSYRFGMNITDNQLYRPLTKAMFAVEWQIAPEKPALSHWINVLFYALLCYVLFRTLSTYMKGTLLVPFITSIIFAAHPLHTEIVANIKSRDEIVCFLLVLLSIWSLHSYVTKNSNKALITSIVCFFIALLAKESAITFLAVIPLMYYFFTNANSSKYFVTLGGLVMVTLIFLGIRAKILGNVETLIPMEDNSLVAIKDFFVREANAIYILGVYLYKMVIPYPLMSDASYNTFPPVGLGSWKFLVPFVVLTGSAVYAVMRFKKKDPISFGILYFFITISLVSNIFILIGTNYGERLMFIPSLGFCLIVAILISKLLNSEKTEKIYTDFKTFLNDNMKPVIALAVILVLFSYTTMARNMTWKDNLTLYMTDVQKVPNSAHMLFYLANHISNEDILEGKPDSTVLRLRLEAIEYLDRAIKVFPKYADGYQRRGLIYSHLKNMKQAEEDYKMALRFNPTHPIVYNNYGTLCFDQKRFEEAMTNFQQAVRYNPNYAHALNNVASVYGVYGLGETEMITKDPANGEAHSKRARENFDMAIAYFLKSIEADREFPEPYRLVAVTYRNIGDAANGERYERLYEQVKATTHDKN
jgi:tetratricopeptide (TPR) repeat protein